MTIKRYAAIPSSLLILTLGRLLFVPIIIVSFDVWPLVTALALAVFIAADLYDGVLARQLDADDPARRALDTIVDRLSIWPVYVAVTLAGFLSPVLLGLFAIRELYTGFWCYRLLRERDIVIRADWMYRSLNLMLAGWIVLAPLLQAQTRVALFVAVIAFSLLVAADLRHSARVVFDRLPSARSMVIPAGDLRSLHRVPRRQSVSRVAIPSFDIRSVE